MALARFFFANAVPFNVTESLECERNWSSYDWIHNKKRNMLTPARAEKLVYVYQNNNAIRKFVNKDDAEKYEAEGMAMLHDEQCSSASEDE